MISFCLLSLNVNKFTYEKSLHPLHERRTNRLRCLRKQKRSKRNCSTNDRAIRRRMVSKRIKILSKTILKKGALKPLLIFAHKRTHKPFAYNATRVLHAVAVLGECPKCEYPVQEAGGSLSLACPSRIINPYGLIKAGARLRSPVFLDRKRSRL